MAKRRSLGRGLEVLLGTEPGVQPVAASDGLRELPIDLLERGRFQPRADLRPESLDELADSIRAQGLVQPIVVRPLSAPGGSAETRYEIVAGERRWRAAQIVGLQTIPALVREMPDRAAVAVALIENVQREDLNALEEAGALRRLVSEFRHDPRRGRRGRGPLPGFGEQSDAVARVAGRGEANARGTRSQHGPRPGAPGAGRPGDAGCVGAARGPTGLERARDRARRAAHHQRRCRSAGGNPPPRIRTCGGWKPNWEIGWGRRYVSSTAPPAGVS